MYKKMIANYHTHTKRCQHAVGEDREYVLKAISEGLSVLGFSDHAPYLYPNDYSSYYKMPLYELANYFESVLSLREEYKGKIDIKIGMEAEYYADIFDVSLSYWRNFPVDYLILGQHILYNEYDKTRRLATDYTESDEDLKNYTEAVKKGLDTGRFSILAHPDIINYHGRESHFLLEMEKVIKKAIEKKVPLEYNILGMRARRNYPRDSFWSLARDMRAPVIIGCDSHDPRDVATESDVVMARENLARFGIRPLDEVELVNPLFFKE